MQADKLTTWLRRERKGAVRLCVLALEIGSTPVPVCDWPAEEITESSDPVGLVLEVCADYTDSKGEAVQFRFEWLRADGSRLGHCHHRQAPIDSESDPSGKHATDADLSVNRIVGQFMRHDEIREKMLVGSLATIFGAFESTIKAQAAIIDSQGKHNVLLHQQLIAAREAATAGGEDTEEARTEALARASAWNKLSEIGPIALQAWLESRAQRSNGAAGGH